MDGFIDLSKPAGPTSHDIVQRVRRLLGVRQVGHGGTLDPLAEGVLPIGIGRATRLLPFFQEGDKSYRAEELLGSSTTTYDAAGAVTATRPVPPFERRDLEDALQSFLGEIEQTPPPFSAIHRAGKRSYERARAGDLSSPPLRRVRIHALRLLDWDPPVITWEVVCGSGTYVRSLAHDLGERLGCGGHLRRLVRLRVGPLTLEEAVSVEDLAAAAAAGRVGELLQPMDLPVRGWPAVCLDEPRAQDVLAGRAIALDIEGEQGRARAYAPPGRLLALLLRRPDDGRWQPYRVFPPAPVGEDNP